MTNEHEAGKIDSFQQESSFSVEIPSKGIYIFCFLFLAATLICTIALSGITFGIFICIFLGPFAAWSFYGLIHCLLWELTVKEDTITIKDVSMEGKSYSIKEITRAKITEKEEKIIPESMLLFTTDKEIANVTMDCVNSTILLERLQHEEIPFYENGEPFCPLKMEKRMPRWLKISSRHENDDKPAVDLPTQITAPVSVQT